MKAISESQLWKKRLGDWVLNPYIGCEHGCFHCYCPAMPGVKFHNEGRAASEWGKYLLPKPGFVDAVRQSLKTFTPDKAKRTEWGNGWLLMSFLTDCYTPSEAKYKVTRECLKLLLEAGHKVRVQTRSALVERDFDILRAHSDRVILGTSLPYMNDSIARVLEPKASSPTRRLQMLRKAVDAGIPIYVAVAPVMPWQPSVLSHVHREIVPLKPREIFCEVLNPKGDNLPRIREALKQVGTPQCEQFAWFISNYTDAIWAYRTCTVLRMNVPPNWIPWPDTGRGWAKYLRPEKVAWLDQFLPKEAACR